MATYFISRHFASKDWIRQQGISIDCFLTHLDKIDHLKAGDVIYGTLPIQLVAQLTARGIAYGHFSLTIPAHLRGVELDLAQLEQCQPKIEFFEVRQV